MKTQKKAAKAENSSQRSRTDANKQRRIEKEARRQQRKAERMWIRSKIASKAAVDPRLAAQLAENAEQREAAKVDTIMNRAERWKSWKSKLADARKRLHQQDASS